MTATNNITRIATKAAAFFSIWAITILFAQGEEPDLRSLSDVELFLHDDKGAARDILDQRTEGYTAAEKAQFQEELRLEIQRRRENPAPLGAKELLDRMRREPHGSRRVQAMSALRKLLENASEAEKESIRDRFLADWERVTYPSIAEERPGAIEERMLFDMYLQESPRLYSSESDYITMLERRCLNRGIEGEMALFLRGLQAQGSAAGPLTAARVERMLGEYRDWGVPEIGYSERGDMLPYLFTTLAHCGRDGLDVLKRKNLTATEQGIRVLGSIDIPEAEDMLWEIYGTTEEGQVSAKVRILLSLQAIQNRNPTDVRRDLIRQELVRFLTVPARPFSLSALDKAVQAAGVTRDAWFAPRLDTLEDELRNLDLTRSNEYEIDPANAARWRDNLQRAIARARERVSRSSLP